MTQRHIGARTLQQVLDQAPTLAQFQEQLALSKKCLAAVTPLISPLMRKTIHAGPIEQHTAPDGSLHKCWVLLADNTAAATKLRQMQPLFLQYIEKEKLPIHEVKINIVPHSSL